uniref:CCHC-type domain-containing protein n=1 Tax=Tanacetum cinerariifolium TaxID=118510 RepID=A0A6L2KME8_TANCI|nr:hypothetical protein [Tanacetum cinerariifolium]
MDDLYNNLKVYEPKVKGMSRSSSSTQKMDFMSSSNNNTSSTNEAVNTAHEVSTTSTQVNVAYSTNIDNLSDVVICSSSASQQNSPQLAHEDLEQIHPDDIEEMDLRWQMAMLTMRARRFLNKKKKLTVNGNETISFDKSNVECYNCHKRGHFARECRALRNHDNKHKESSRSVLVETSTFTSLVSCDGLGGYDWSDQAEEGPNYALVAFSSSSSDSEISNDSTCSKSCLETVKLLKSQNDQLLKDLKKSELMVLVYTTGLESVEERLEFYKANESIYLEDIKDLKFEIQIGGITIRELRMKLEIVQNEKHGIQLNGDKFKHASKSLNKLIECYIVGNCKKGLGYENYNAVLPPYTGNFMPPTPDLSFTSLDEFVNKPVVENYKAMSSKEKPKVVRKYDDALIIEEWVSNDEDEDVSQSKIKKKIVRPSIVKIERQNLSKITLWTNDLLFSQDPKSSYDDGSKPSSDVVKKVDEDPIKESKYEDQEKEDNVNSTNNVNTAGNVNIVSSTVNATSINEVNVVGKKISIKLPFDPKMLTLEDDSIFDFSSDDEDDGAVADMNNLDTTIQEEPKKVIHALKDPSWIEAMQEELLQFKNKKDERGIMIRNKASLVAQGYTQEEGINYAKFFAPIARIEAIRLFLAYVSFKDFMVYQMDVKSAFLYGRIEEEVYVCQPPGFEDPDFPDRVYKVEKTLYGLHQAPRACAFERLMHEKFQISSMRQLAFFLGLQKSRLSMIGSLMYLTSSRSDILFAVCACARYQANSKVSHLYVVKRICKYLKGQPKLVLWYPKDSPSVYARASLDRSLQHEVVNYLDVD